MPRTEPAPSYLESYRLLLTAIALYDGILGLLFLALYRPIFGLLGIPLPENPIYLQLAAGCVALFGLGFWYAAQHPVRNIDLVRVGVGLKVFFVLLVVYALVRNLLPHPVFIILAFLDAVTVVGIVLLWRGIPMPRD